MWAAGPDLTPLVLLAAGTGQQGRAWLSPGAGAPAGPWPVLLLFRGPAEHVHIFFFLCNKQRVLLLFREVKPRTRSRISTLLFVAACGREEQPPMSTVTEKGNKRSSPLFCITEWIFEQHVGFNMPWTGHKEDLLYLA